MAALARLILAPLRGLTDAVFRSVYAAHFNGLDEAMAPFTPAVGGRVTDRLLGDLNPEANLVLPVVPQILGNAPNAFLEVAARFADWGYTRVNWNLGCPFPMVARKGRGSGLLPYPERVAAFLDQVMPRLPLQLSIKMRLGRWDSAEIFGLLPIFEGYPLDAIVIHPRTGVQMYAGSVDLESFGRCLDATGHRVVYNGDIGTPADFKRLAGRFPRVDRWMLGRGVLTDPLLPARIKGLALPSNPTRRLEQFHDALLAAYAARLSGPGHLIDRMKGFWRYLAGSFTDGERVWRRVRRVGDLAGYRQAVEAVFAEAELKAESSFQGAENRPMACR